MKWKLPLFIAIAMIVSACSSPVPQVVEVTRLVEVTTTSQPTKTPRPTPRPTATRDDCSYSVKREWILPASEIAQAVTSGFLDFIGEVQENTGIDKFPDIILSSISLEESIALQKEILGNLDTPDCLEAARVHLDTGLDLSIEALDQFQLLEIDEFIRLGTKTVTELKAALELMN